ncbi:hypothetical protein RHGRI_036193 [Rhododendron griersonianum]|uniref:Ubiquitin-like domain-containing protein n=1 Tax=Rhododendron griersonianum TaxID=479676 RepID=A0AAV6HN18_9ERIC|nr:hypothetical protein RHGRI_036193 [Rhododendron griersonianum]
MEKVETNGDDITVNIKFGGRSIPVSLSSDSTVRHLKSLLQPLTNVLPRGQKLIFKGKVLVDESTLKSSGVSNGAKIMLMASQGLHQGDGPIKKETPASSNLRRNADGNQVKEKREVTVEKSRTARWKATGVIALSQCNLRKRVFLNVGREKDHPIIILILKAIPDEVWNCGPSARVLDLSHNSVEDVPAKIGCLSSIQKLLLNANEISDNSISWEGLTSLKSLTNLSLSQNYLHGIAIIKTCVLVLYVKSEIYLILSSLHSLTTLPSSLDALACLTQLDIANNKLTSLPDEIGHLTQLQVLKANNNRICAIPTSIGECTSLVEVDLSANLLVDLPETFGNLHNLKALHLSNNGLKSLPPTLFKMCIRLSTLDLHGSEITMDLLRQLLGWEDFDKRRRLKLQKQLDFRAGGSAEFDEGADKSF